MFCLVYFRTRYSTLDAQSVNHFSSLVFVEGRGAGGDAKDLVVRNKRKAIEKVAWFFKDSFRQVKLNQIDFLRPTVFAFLLVKLIECVKFN